MKTLLAQIINSLNSKK